MQGCHLKKLKKGAQKQDPKAQEKQSTNAIYTNEPVSPQRTISPEGKQGNAHN